MRPHILEVNAWTWLTGVRERHGAGLALGEVPEQELLELAWPRPGLDAVWLMGVWERSPEAARIARTLLPECAPADVVGSPYAVRRCVVDEQLGGPEALARLRERLRVLGLRLILDFIPNHVARDHAWTREAPGLLVGGSAEDLRRDPSSFFETRGRVLAHGRDPFFPAWPDTVQVDAFSGELRGMARQALLAIAEQCDGVRCDMAMLVTNAVFARTWGERVGPPPREEYWRALIPAVRARHPDFLLLAEVYWDLEPELLAQGFDYCYDKRLYDRMRDGQARDVLDRLRADVPVQDHLLRFTENHDEERAPAAFGFDRAWASAVLVATLPGAKLWHEGQFAGHAQKLPVQLGRRPPEPGDPALRHFYALLLEETSRPVYREGRWALLGAPDGMIACGLRREEERRLVVVNFSPARVSGRVALADLQLAGRAWRLRDLLGNHAYERSGDEMAGPGLLVELPSWGAHLFVFTPL